MLVLSRKEGEELVINGESVITVLEIHKSFVRLGIAAPSNVRIMRSELLEEAEIDEAV